MPPRGRPTLFSLQKSEQAYSLAQAGCTDQEMADELGISANTFYRWRNEHPEFREATRLGKEAADERVTRSLYHRALGYSHQAVKIFMPAGSTEPVYAPYTEHFPPDTQAASLWLRNRQPDKWRDKQDVEHSGDVSLTVVTGVPGSGS
jgi:hypothetical protein